MSTRIIIAAAILNLATPTYIDREVFELNYIPPTTISPFFRKYQPLNYTVHHTRTMRRLSDTTRQIHFKGPDGRPFTLILEKQKSAEVFTKDFSVITESMGETKVDVSNALYKGRVLGDPNSDVSGSISSDGTFIGRIELGNGKVYHTEPARNYIKNSPFHSVLYDTKDIRVSESTPKLFGCGVKEKGKSYLEILKEQEEIKRRFPPRMAKQQKITKLTCNMKISMDHLLYGMVTTSLQDEIAREEAASFVARHISRASETYRTTKFGSIQQIRIVLQKLIINDSKECLGKKMETNPFCKQTLDVNTLLHYTSRENNDKFCLAFTFSYRDFTDGTLGLAWIARDYAGSGGICDKHQLPISNNVRGPAPLGTKMSLNTGIVTFVNYNQRVSEAVSYNTFIHEVGHNFGSDHDDDNDPVCSPDHKNGGKFLMHPSSNRVDAMNSRQFSPCSTAQIGGILEALMITHSSGKENCFQESSTVCGNNIVEENEVCDCGETEADCAKAEDTCCYPADHKMGCKLKEDAQCSMSMGSCCKDCQFMKAKEECRRSTNCRETSYCAGGTAVCPVGKPLPDGTLCHKNTETCFIGECSGSICSHVKLKPCYFSGNGYSPEEKCLLACKKDDKCVKATDIPKLKKVLGTERSLPSGSLCEKDKGRCDVFHVCRMLDSRDAIERLQMMFLGGRRSVLKKLFASNPLVTFIVITVLVIVIILLFRICALQVSTNNPLRQPTMSLRAALDRPYAALFYENLEQAKQMGDIMPIVVEPPMAPKLQPFRPQHFVETPKIFSPVAR